VQQNERKELEKRDLLTSLCRKDRFLIRIESKLKESESEKGFLKTQINGLKKEFSVGNQKTALLSKVATNASQAFNLLPTGIRYPLGKILTSNLTGNESKQIFNLSPSTTSKVKKADLEILAFRFKVPKETKPRIEVEWTTEFWYTHCPVDSGSRRKIRDRKNNILVPVHIQKQTTPKLHNNFVIESQKVNKKSCCLVSFIKYKQLKQLIC